MPKDTTEQLATGPVPQVHSLLIHQQRVFQGFAPPTSNTTYTPNQFFDVCIPHYSRGCVRLVAYMIRRTLGWCDANGNPQEDQIVMSYNDLVDHAGISRSMIAKVIEEALAGGFIRCVRSARPDSAGKRAISALYELRWHDSPEYIKDPSRFHGFYEGEGNRTDIPNEYFDVVVRNEPLSVIKVVGSIIRFSIGFQARRGQRRQQVQLSFSDIQRYARIKSREDLSQAVAHALEQNYIVRLQEGLFTPDKVNQLTTTYSIKWSDKPLYLATSSKSVPEPVRKTNQKTGSKSVPEDQFEIRTRTGSKNEPEDRFEIRTTIEMKQTNETSKQQQPAKGGPAVAVESSILTLLKTNGFSTRDAEELATKYPAQRIQDQINWLGRRNPSRNPIGMLRRAIEENWPEPPSAQVRTSELSSQPGFRFAAHFYAGFAGNKGEPTAEPSVNDYEQAERYIQRLLEVWPDAALVGEWGRRFGEFVFETNPSPKGHMVSCVSALRSYGDRFYTKIRGERKELVREAVKKAAARHKKRFHDEYLRFLSAEEERFRAEHPETYASFEEKRGFERTYIEKSRFYTPEEIQEQLQLFESSSRRLLAFGEFFEEVPNFWDWDQRFNGEPFDKTKVIV